MYVRDSLDMFNRHEADIESVLAKMPVCEECGNHIQDDYYFLIDGVPMCEDCLISHYRHSTDEFVS